MSCYDVDNNIATADLKTDGVIMMMNQNPSSVEMLVHYEGSVSVDWQVCDSNNQCIGGTFP